jgi:hypothetical protein
MKKKQKFAANSTNKIWYNHYALRAAWRRAPRRHTLCAACWREPAGPATIRAASAPSLNARPSLAPHECAAIRGASDDRGPGRVDAGELVCRGAAFAGRMLTARACAVPGHPPVPGPLRHRLRRQHHLRCHRRGRQHWLHLELRPELRRPRHQEPDRPLLARQLGHCRHRLLEVRHQQRPHHHERQHRPVPGHRRLRLRGLMRCTVAGGIDGSRRKDCEAETPFCH